MIRFQRNLKTVNSDLRENSRIEFHHPAVILGIDTMARILDFSLGGFYIETDQMDKINNCQRLRLGLKLPDEKAYRRRWGTSIGLLVPIQPNFINQYFNIPQNSPPTPDRNL